VNGYVVSVFTLPLILTFSSIQNLYVHKKLVVKKSTLITGLLIAVIFCGCKGFCGSNLINPVFIGFSPSGIDTIVFKQFTQNDSFNILIDSMLIVNPSLNNGFGYAIYTSWGDTTLMTINVSPPYSPIIPGYDWTIYIPSKNKTITISKIHSPITYGNRGCNNPINSFVQDGQLISYPTLVDSSGEDWKFYGYRAYIHP
jgi:hypothetical protein